MTATHMKGHIKETAGKLTGDTEMQVEGTLEKGFADVKRVVGDAVDLVTDTVTTGINTVVNAVIDVYKIVTKTIKNLF